MGTVFKGRNWKQLASDLSFPEMEITGWGREHDAFPIEVPIEEVVLVQWKLVRDKIDKVSSKGSSK